MRDFIRLTSVLSNLVVVLITVIVSCYKLLLSPLLGNRCRYYPSCSDYAKESLREWGLSKGLCLTFKRILSCHSSSSRNPLDPVPKKPNFQQKIIPKFQPERDSSR